MAKTGILDDPMPEKLGWNLHAYIERKYTNIEWCYIKRDTNPYLRSRRSASG